MRVVRGCACLGLLVSLGACGDGRTQIAISQTATSGVPGYAEEALTDAGRKFLSADRAGARVAAAPRREAPRSGGGSINLTPGSSTPYDEEAGQVSEISVVRRDAIGGMALRSTLSLGYAQKRVTLPQGLGILTDPMTVDLTASTVTAEVAAVMPQEMGQGWRAEYAAGLGLVAADAEIALQSDLIDLKAQTRGTEAYLTLGAQVQQQGGLFLDGQMRVYDDLSTEFRSGIGYAF